MSRGKERLIELYGEAHPGFGSYLECMTRTYFTGLATFSLAFSTTYITQNLLKHKLPYSHKFFILSSTVVGTVLAYRTTRERSALCQAAWLATEEKNTYFTPIENISTNKTVVKPPNIVSNLILAYNTKMSTERYFSSSSSEIDEDETKDKEYEELVLRAFRVSEMGHQVFVIQPYIKWGNLKKINTTPELQLDEAVALIKTLPQWKVISHKLIPLMSFSKTVVFGKGNLDLLVEEITKNNNITAVFISINMLSPLQHSSLEEVFKVPVFDRYNIVIQIFKLHALTKEAKIQVAMAEIPYLWSRFRFDDEDISDKMGGGATIGGPGETYLEIKKRLLQDKERKLKNELKKLKNHRDKLRYKRQKLELPTVAVVGYTNAGKTSLIKALTKEEALQPRDVLFATLDVTVHSGVMPSGLKVLFVDTVGFLSDIPTNLIQSFTVTLEDAVQADLIIHVQDVSHPDLKAQHEHVIKTLKSINLPEQVFENILTVGNKVDLLEDPSSYVGESMLVSATTGVGLDELKMRVENKIIKATGQIFIKIRVPNGGDEYKWLHKEATVVNVVADEDDYQFAFINTLITDTNLKRFKHIFILSKQRKKT